jgi:hypothetical protein
VSGGNYCEASSEQGQPADYGLFVTQVCDPVVTPPSDPASSPSSAASSATPVLDARLHDLALCGLMVIVFALGFMAGNQGGGAA